MIAPDASPIGHVPPLPRIDLGARVLERPDEVSLLTDEGRASLDRINRKYWDHVWQMVRQAAGVAE